MDVKARLRPGTDCGAAVFVLSLRCGRRRNCSRAGFGNLRHGLAIQ
jgi:hypothetical protein